MTDRAWETLSSQTAYSCAGFDIVNERVELPGGERAEFDYLAEGESVVILPFTPDGDVVVIDEWRHAVKRDNRGLPAGSVETDEQPSAAVARELREETGYEAGKIEHLCSLEPANGFADAYFHYFVAHDCTPAGEQSLDADETIDVTTTAFDELLDVIRDDEFEDGRAATGVLYYALFEQ
jgi:ADP-ribose pyrophosphatase